MEQLNSRMQRLEELLLSSLQQNENGKAPDSRSERTRPFPLPTSMPTSNFSSEGVLQYADRETEPMGHGTRLPQSVEDILAFDFPSLEQQRQADDTPGDTPPLSRTGRTGWSSTWI